MSLFDMKGKVAVITGSTKGIGRAIAERMAEHGAKVVISSRKQDVCDSVAKEINDKFGKDTAIAIAANISSKENLQNLVDRDQQRLRQDRRAGLQRRVQSPITVRSPASRTSSSGRSWTTTSSPTTG